MRTALPLNGGKLKSSTSPMSRTTPSAGAGELPAGPPEAGRDGLQEEGGERQKEDNDHHADTRAPARMPRRAEPAAAGQQHDRRN